MEAATTLRPVTVYADHLAGGRPGRARPDGARAGAQRRRPDAGAAAGDRDRRAGARSRAGRRDRGARPLGHGAVDHRARRLRSPRSSTRPTRSSPASSSGSSPTGPPAPSSTGSAPLVEETTRQGREQLVRQFSSADASNPLADFKNGVLRVTQQQVAGDGRDARAGRRAAGRGRPPARGEGEGHRGRRRARAARPPRAAPTRRPSSTRSTRSPAGMATSPSRSATRQAPAAARATSWSGIEGCAGPSRGRIVIEAKHSQISRNAALAYLDEAMAQRDADYGIWVVPSEDDAARAHAAAARGRPATRCSSSTTRPRATTWRCGSRYAMARARVLMAPQRHRGPGLGGRPRRGRARGARPSTRSAA